MKSNLAVVSPILESGGAKFTETGLVFGRDPTEQQLRESGAQIARIRKALDWCQGDHTSAWLRFINQRDREEGIKPRLGRERQMELQHINEYAEATGLNTRHLIDCEQLAHFFPPELRRPALEFGHHAEVFHAFPEELATANEWLDRAERGAWSVSELRKAIRKHTASKSDQEEEEAPDNTIDRKLGEFELWSSKQLLKVSTLTRHQALVALGNLGRTHEYIKALVHRIETGGPG